MPVYKYRAATKQGDVVENRVEVANKFILLKKLKQSELLPISITSINVKSNKKINKQKRNLETSNSVLKQVRAEQIRKNMEGKEDSFLKKANAFLNKGKKITKKDIKVFTQNFFLLKKANFNNIHALSTVLETIENPTLKAIVEDILLGVEAGENIYTTMEYYSSVFPPIYVNMIKVGEMSGALTNALEQAVNYLEETEAMNRKLKSILVPNIIQFVGLFVLLIVGTIVAMPMLQGVLDQFGSKDQLPKMTIQFSKFLDFVISIWYVPVGIIVAVAAVIIWYVHTPKGKYKFHLFKYKMPVFGKLIYAIDFSRLCQSILLNLKNGMRIQDALETGKNVSNNLVMLSIIESAINNTVTGQSWIEPFEESGLSTPMITEMLKIGMQTDLTEMMEKLVAYMQIDIDEIMQRIIKILPQIVYLIVGVMLIFVVIVVLVPMINMYMGGWMFSAFDI